MELELKLHDKQLIAFERLISQDKLEVLFGGAKNGGKSYLGASWIFGSALMYPGTRWFIARKELIDLRKYTTPTVMEVFQNWNLPFVRYGTYNGQDNTFLLGNGSLVNYIACPYMPSDPMYERFGSMQFTGGWVEEGGEIPDMAYENLKLAVGRWMNDKYKLPYKILITCNPKKNWMYRDFVRPAKDGKLPKGKVFVQSLVTDNTFRQSGSEQVLDSIKDKITKQRLRFGEWEYADDPSSLMTYDSIQSIFTNDHVQPRGFKYITADIARFGDDATTVRVWHGLVVIDYCRLEKKSTLESAQLIKQLMRKHEVPANRVLIDEDGIGGGVVDQVAGSKGFIANARPLFEMEHEKYQNLKSQCAYKLAELVNGAKIYEHTQDIDLINRLTSDLEQVKDKDTDKEGVRAIQSKDEARSVLGRSPDDGDTYIMRAYFELMEGKGLAAPKNSVAKPNKRTIYNM